MLKFDKTKLANELLKNLEIELEVVFDKWKQEVRSRMRNKEFQNNAYLEKEIKRQTNEIIVYLKANTYVLADSYGTGSLMLSDNPGFQNYIVKTSYNSNAKGGSFNPARKGKAIVGRPAGHYTDIFGKGHDTSGTFEGVNIEGKVVNPGKKRRFTGTIFSKKYRIEPIAPSKAIQDAEILTKTHINRAYKLAIKKTDFAKFLIES